MAQTIQRTFAGGELAPVLHSRADTTKYLSSLRTCRNFLVRKEGGVTKRPGLRFIAAAKTATAGTRFMRYVGEGSTDNILIEVGALYFRFFEDTGSGWGPLTLSGVPAYNGATAYVPGDIVASAGVNYYCIANTTGNAPPNATFWYAMPGALLEIPTPYAIGDVFKWNQSGTVITITHRSHAPRELTFINRAHWTLLQVSTAPTLTAVTGGVATAGGAGTRTFSYIVTAAATETYEESPASAPFACVSADPSVTAPIALVWTAKPGAAEYYVYADPYGNGVYGYIGTASTNAFNDTGFVADFNVTPPIPRVLFNSANNYPEVSANYQQRRFFANTSNNPDSVYGSRIGFPANFGIASPLQDDDAVTFRLAGNNHHPVRFMVALKAGLILMTDGGEWIVTGAGGPQTPITPSSINADQDTYVGIAATVPPTVVGNAILYTQARGRVVRELRFDINVEGLAGKDLTIFATHLFDGHRIVAMDFQQTPDSIIWCLRDDGVLLGLTYIPEQEVWGWHRHDTTNGTIENIVVVPGIEEDVLFALVARSINGATVRYIERLESRTIVDWNSDVFFVDSGLSYSGASVNSVSGLNHLEGQVVAVVADGVAIFDGNSGDTTNAALYTVTGGVINLPAFASDIHVGLPIYFAEVETLDLDVQGSDIADKKKQVRALTLLVESSSRSFRAGAASTSTLRQYSRQPWEGSAKSFTGKLELNIETQFDQYGRAFIRQSDPLPLTIIGIVPDVGVGG